MYKFYLFVSILAASHIPGMPAGDTYTNQNANQSSKEYTLPVEEIHHTYAKSGKKKDSPKYSKQMIGGKFTFVQQSSLPSNTHSLSACTTILTTKNNNVDNRATQFISKIPAQSTLSSPIHTSEKNTTQEEDCLCVAIQSNQSLAVQYLLSIGTRTSVKAYEQLKTCTNLAIYDLMVQACVKECGNLFK